MNIHEAERQYQIKMGRKELLEEQLKEAKKTARGLKRSIKLNEKAQIVIQEVVKLTQDKLKHHVSDISSLAMASIFDEPYDIEVEFLPKRGKVETEIWFVRDGVKVSPLYASGGGTIDIAALSLRMSCWTLQNPRTRPILILDEPLKFLSRRYQEKASRLLQDISRKLDIQIIMNSHSPELIDCADKVINVKLKNGKSVVE